jgi:hypothetical protein
MSEFIAPFPVIGREPSTYVSTFFNEVVICRMPDGSVRKLLMKRGSTHGAPSREHRGGVPYEAQVYQRVLAPLAMSVPAFHGATSTPSETVLWMDYEEDAQPLHKFGNASLRDAAVWIGEFHRRNEARSAELVSLLRRYNLAYYLRWARRTMILAAPLGLTWLPQVCAAYEKMAKEFSNAALTIIHGEFYPKNILVRADRSVVPVDWESAAVAMGEIDVASLVEGWSEEDSLSCQRAYQQARWPGGAPDGFTGRLQFATLYWLFRWLGDASQWRERENPQERIRQLKDFAENMKLTSASRSTMPPEREKRTDVLGS